jgi:hypothetical protein
MTLWFGQFRVLIINVEQGTKRHVSLQWQLPAGCFIRRTRTQVIAGTFTVHQGGIPAYNDNSASTNTGMTIKVCTHNMECLQIMGKIRNILGPLKMYDVMTKINILKEKKDGSLRVH